MKYEVRKRKPIPFSWRFEDEMIQKWRFFKSDMVSLRESWNGEDNEQSQKFKGKTENV